MESESIKSVDCVTEKEHKKIAGYRELNDAEIAMINRVKELGTAIEALISYFPDGVDGRWVSIGKTHLQQGLMALTRAIAKPDHF
ncbi:MAG: hypothetical protein HGA87_00930 [Desulfobulbaceae bacterium]|nr:hypothetical protein [Desulfobulbaceae bacterium]